MSEFVLYLVLLAFVQNLILSTGLGASLIVRVTRRPRDILVYGATLCFFTELSILATYPLDGLIGTSPIAKFLRPAMMIAVAAVLYLIITPLIKRWLPQVYRRISYLIPQAAFNTMIIGLLLIINHQFSISLPGALGIGAGSSIGFVLISWVVVEGIDRLDNPDTPGAFRGLPGTLLYLGILALALMGFGSHVSLI